MLQACDFVDCVILEESKEKTGMVSWLKYKSGCLGRINSTWHVPDTKLHSVLNMCTVPIIYLYSIKLLKDILLQN